MLAALAGNLAIAVVKFAAFLFTRSSAMLTESIHSLVDTGDQLLLLTGQARGSRPPDATHPLGYGMETYFWSFIVALMVFLLGGGGVDLAGRGQDRPPVAMSRPWINYVVLAISAVFEAGFLHGRLPRIPPRGARGATSACSDTCGSARTPA
ncbi:MAG: cation transporter [Caulobacteraceae bacterium]